MKAETLPTPYYIVYEDKLRKNLDLISDVAKRSGAHIIMAFKANALWRTFDIFKEYGIGFTASSLNELQLGREFLGDDAHSYCPVYTDATIDKFIAGSSHITFNSIDQWKRHKHKVLANGKVSPGLRVNPKCSVIETDIYNPTLPGSRFGVSADQLQYGVPKGIEGLHFHALCESSSYDLEKVLNAFEEQFGHLLSSLKWVNFGGGHLMTSQGYDTEHLISLIKDFRSRHPHLQVIMEPGSAFTWRTGDLVTQVMDVVENDGISTAIVDVSFACHMPDTLEMPYQPIITESIKNGEEKPGMSYFEYRLGGNSCLSGDYCGPWTFDHQLVAGEKLTLEDMNHYTTVKTTMFNGIQHPDIVLCRKDGECEYLRRFDYEDYKNRMS